MNGQLTSYGYVVLGYETSERKKARNPYHTCGAIMQYNKHGVLVCPVCRPQPTNKHNQKVYKSPNKKREAL